MSGLGRRALENIADAGNVAGQDKSFGFSDIVDMINPAQHIPVVSNLYQSAIEDTMGAIAITVGGAIFGGNCGQLLWRVRGWLPI